MAGGWVRVSRGGGLKGVTGSSATGFGNQDAIAQQSSLVLASNRANRDSAAPAGENDASVPQRVSRICAEADVAAGALAGAMAGPARWADFGKIPPLNDPYLIEQP